MIEALLVGTLSCLSLYLVFCSAKNIVKKTFENEAREEQFITSQK